MGQGQIEVLPTYPQSGWVEHDPDALIASVGSQVTQALARRGGEGRPDRGHRPDQPARDDDRLGAGHRPADRAGPGLAGPPHRRGLRAAARASSDWISKATGLVIDPYFSATKIAWILDHVPGARPRADGGRAGRGDRR